MTVAARASHPDPSRMRQEIGQIPATVDRIVAGAAADHGKAARAFAKARPRFAMIVARGTSDHAANYAQYLFETHLGLPTGLAKPSVTTIYQRTLRWKGGLLVAISQSGQSPDVAAVVRAAREGGALTIAITNATSSPLGTAAEHVLPCHAGRELAVPATKTYVAELAVVASLVATIAGATELTDALAMTAADLRTTIERTDRWLRADAGSDAIKALAAANRALVISRGYNLATALELSLKFKETCGLFAEAYSTADFAHGPMVLTERGMAVLAIRPDGPMGRLVDDTLQEVKARGGVPILIGAREAEDVPGSLALPLDLPEELTPLVYIVPGQLLVEATARARGVSPDSPEGLGKVTLTR
ncbi:MAG TPA: SIS domain-containing protein [Candidatus Limnocylindria bacterium]|nr:SIS domain-containing protein [Candidatus Limnocylindria bacterium]